MTDVVERTEMVLPEPAEAFSGLLGVSMPDLAGGEGLPLLWHWLYLLERPAQGDLGVDGHPVRGAILAPPEPGKRRIWVGGRIHSTGWLQCGKPATRHTSVVSTRKKDGRSGRLTFVTVGHRISQGGRIVIDEERGIVYRDAVPFMSPQTPADDASTRPVSVGEWSIETSSTLLFRFSALTYNGHRIHYDRDYARDVEGYPGLVVHGPLQAMVMAEAVRRQQASDGSNTHFEYRLVAPLFDHQGLVVSTKPDGPRTKTATSDRSGRQTAIGTFLHL